MRCEESGALGPSCYSLGATSTKKLANALGGIMQEHGLIVTQIQIVGDVQINQGLILIKLVKRLEY
jgi:stage V sporulation protein SpoVS